MCVRFKHLVTLSACKGEDSENIRSLLIIALENEIWLGGETRGWEKRRGTEMERTVFLLNQA